MKNDDKLEFTGERYTPEIKGSIQLEHYHRYYFAEQFVDSKLVLDIASGEGFGSYILSKRARAVTGVDISHEAINHAINKYHNENLIYQQGSAAEIPFTENSFDVVVSFETIEHHDLHHEMLSEIKRVLKPDGVLVISSPNKKNYSEIPQQENHFHVKELYQEEFKALVSDYFQFTKLLGQQVVFGSAIVGEGNNRLLELANDGEVNVNNEPIYDIIVASNEKLKTFSSGILKGDISVSDTVQQCLEHIKLRDERLLKSEQDYQKLASQYNELKNNFGMFVINKCKNNFLAIIRNFVVYLSKIINGIKIK